MKTLKLMDGMEVHPHTSVRTTYYVEGGKHTMVRSCKWLSNVFFYSCHFWLECVFVVEVLLILNWALEIGSFLSYIPFFSRNFFCFIEARALHQKHTNNQFTWKFEHRIRVMTTTTTTLRTMNIQQLHLIVYAKEEWKQMNNGMDFFKLNRRRTGGKLKKGKRRINRMLTNPAFKNLQITIEDNFQCKVMCAPSKNTGQLLWR